jgi:hypothetical protein
LPSFKKKQITFLWLYYDTAMPRSALGKNLLVKAGTRQLSLGVRLKYFNSNPHAFIHGLDHTIWLIPLSHRITISIIALLDKGLVCVGPPAVA